jgi:ligand-binding sensor domain-containing protein
MEYFFRVLLFGILNLLSLSATTQVPYLKQYTVSDGLLTNEIFQVYQDSRGYMWFATAYGACKFDGKHFIQIDNPKEFRNSSITEIKEDRKKQLWFVSLKGRLYYSKSSKIIPYVYNTQIQDRLYTNKGHIRDSFIPFSDSSVVISFKERGAVVVRKNGIVNYKYPNQKSVVLFDFSEREPFVSFQNKRLGEIVHVEVRDPGKPSLIINTNVVPTHIYAARLKNGNKVFSLDRVVYVVGNGWHKKFEMADAVTGIYQDRDSHIWLSINGHGAYCYLAENFNCIPSIKILEKEVITSILQDREGSYWFSTLNSGVYFTPSLSFVNFTTKNGLLSNKLSRVISSDGEVWIGYADGFVSKIGKDAIIRHVVDIKKQPTSVKGLNLCGDSKSVWVCSDILYRISNRKIEPIEKTFVRGNKNPNYALLPRAIENSRDGGIWVASNRGFKKVLKGEVVYDSYETGDFTGVVYSLSEEENGDLWIASNSLFLFSKGKVRPIGALGGLLNTSIVKSAINSYDHRLWLGTKGNGIIVLNGNRLIQINGDKGLQSDNISSFDFSGNKVWVATNCGADCITINQINPLKYSIRHYNTSHGLISNDVKDVSVMGNRVYFATTSGLSCFDISKGADNNVPPPVTINSVKVNDKEVELDRLSKLNYDQNFVDISFSGLTYKCNGDVKYRYRVDGLSDRWFYTAEGTISLYKLPPGDYKLIIAAENNDHVWSSKPAVVCLSIAKPFWATYWFNGVCLIVIAVIALFILRTRLRIVQKIRRHEQKENLWKNQSLSLQMNPHFIFNTLNSIQLYILKCDVDSSLHYLSKFSSLMRKTLENSDKMNVTLKEELESLELYLELESLRCEGKFKYRIECDPSISLSDSYIPTLLIQPYVENAIWHGIMPKTSNGHILIKIQNAGTFVKCSIADDGIGRVKSQEIQNMSLVRKHKSFATKIVGQRIEILKSLYNKDFSFEYIDKYDDEGNALGTEVILIFPRDFVYAKQVNQIVES